jgi:hypothetical protein
MNRKTCFKVPKEGHSLEETGMEVTDIDFNYSLKDSDSDVQHSELLGFCPTYGILSTRKLVFIIPDNGQSPETQQESFRLRSWCKCLRIKSCGGFCKDTDKCSDPISSGEFVGQLSDYKLIKKYALLSVIKLLGLSPRANYIDRATSACRRA